MANCLIVGNIANNTIGGLQMANDAAHKVYNNTIVGNKQTASTNADRCGVHLNVNAAAEFVNNIVYGNTANNTDQANQLQISSSYKSSYSAYFKNNAVVLASTFGTNTTLLTEDPGLTDISNADAANNDYSLLPTSDLIGSGSNSVSAVVGATDLAGNTRIVGSTIDIGAYEDQMIYSDTYVQAGEDLQAKINNTAAGYTVYVEAGTFYGNFTMKNGVNVSGGWNHEFTEQTDYATILDANNSGRVVNQPANFTTLTVWSNLTIQHGKLTANLDTYGSGVFLRKNGQVKHCVIQDNTFTYTGTNCMGGGVANNEVNASSDVLIDECIIRRNNATHGGGVRIVGTIQNSIIEDNSTTNNACGGVHLFNGGCMYNCIIRNNTAGTAANAATGGVRMSGTAGTLANCLIVGNHATDRTGGLSLENNTHVVYNNTIVNNSQASSSNPDWCGVRLNVGGPLQFCNNIVWGNRANDVEQPSQIMVLNTYGSQVNNFVNNALVWNGKLSDGNDFEVPSTIFLTESPFADADYHLLPFSELINSGHNGKFSGTTDLDGNARKQGGIDRGCYERTKVSRAVSAGQTWGTVCMPFDIASEAIDGATMYKVISFASTEKTGLLLEAVEDMEAGKPYFFQVDENATAVQFGYVCAGDEAAAGNENGLYGTIADGTVIDGSDYYVLQAGELRPVTGGAVTMPANRAYLKFSEVPDFHPGAPVTMPRRVLTITRAPEVATGLDNVQEDNVQCTKVIRNGQLVIVRDGKAYNVQGQQLR